MSKIIGRPLYAPAPAGGGKPSVPKFTYDGDYVIRDDGVVELLTSGTIVFLEPKVIDVFMVGGGGGGGYQNNSGPRGSGGGGGGYTRTARRVNVIANQNYQIQIGEGGSVKNGEGQNGSASAFGNYTVSGGSHGTNDGKYIGGSGGSGGGGGVKSDSDYGAGGSDGNDGENGYPETQKGGNGQGSTTREFGEATGKLYAGGGGGGRYIDTNSPVISMGGDGGGGAGGWRGAVGSSIPPTAAVAGIANTGGGGGGGVHLNAANYVHAATGGSGIVCFRDAQELPELAGTWVFNERLYAPESALGSFNISGYFLSTTGQQATFQTFGVDKLSVYFTRAGNVYNYYTFSTNKRTDGYSTTIVFPSGATASDEFRAWLASNATKQTA